MSVREQIDTNSAAGRFYMHMLAALAEFERELIRDRTRAGMAAARARGVAIGRPRKLSSLQIEEARSRLALGEQRSTIAADLGVSRATLSNSLRA